jgi:predicted transcriptional regulator
VVISLRLPTALVKRLDQIARREERSRAKVLEIAARAYAESKAA